jgi:hypothetical protein
MLSYAALQNLAMLNSSSKVTPWLCSLRGSSDYANEYDQSYISSQLLSKIQNTNNDPLWDTSPDMLAWLLHIGGAFAPVGSIRAGYMALVHSNHNKLRKLCTSWSELLEILKRFIWSEKAFASQVESFWEESVLTRP